MKLRRESAGNGDFSRPKGEFKKLNPASFIFDKNGNYSPGMGSDGA